MPRYLTSPHELRTAKTMRVWWNMKSSPVPEGYDPLLVRRSIESYFRKREYSGSLTIVAFGNLEDIPVEVLRAYSDTGIVMKHDPFFESACEEDSFLGCRNSSTIVTEVTNWKISNISNPELSSPVLFISNPENAFCLYIHMVTGLPMSERNVLLAYDPDPDFGPPNFTLKDLLEDAKIDCAGKSIEDEEFRGKPRPRGGIFCAVCNTYWNGGTRVEAGDLTTHLRSETHEIEMFGKQMSGKKLCEGDLRLAYKWGAYHNIPLERMTRELRNHPENKRKSKEGKMITTG